jgi:hypothetical protein
MSTHLEAGFVYTSDQDGVVMVGFADQQFDTRRYVLLQRTRDVSDEERARGENDVHFEIDGQERSDYGVIDCVEVERGAVRIALRADKAADLEMDAEIRVTFKVNTQKHSQLVNGLRSLWEHNPQALTIKP